MAPLRISSHVARLHLQAARERGISLDGVLAAHGLAQADLDDEEGEIDVAAMNALWREMERLVGADYGLLLAERSEPFLGVVDYCARHAPDGRALLGAILAYQRLLHGPARAFFLDEDPAAGTVTLRFVPPTPVPPPGVVADFVLGRFVVLLRRNTGVGFAPRRAAFRHAAPPDLAAHRRVLGCPVDFDAPVDAVVLDVATLAAPLLAADPALDAILGRHARELVARRPREVDVIGDVRRAIVDGLRGGALPGAAEVARRLATTERTLRRRLQDAGTTFQTLADDVRRELAQSYLRDPAVKTAEVAFLVGFSEVSTFHRAFRRWTGATPFEYRRGVAAPANPLSGHANEPPRGAP